MRIKRTKEEALRGLRHDSRVCMRESWSKGRTLDEDRRPIRRSVSKTPTRRPRLFRLCRSVISFSYANLCAERVLHVLHDRERRFPGALVDLAWRRRSLPASEPRVLVRSSHGQPIVQRAVVTPMPIGWVHEQDARRCIAGDRAQQRHERKGLGWGGCGEQIPV